jgi:anti-anti-sigma factor
MDLEIRLCADAVVVEGELDLASAGVLQDTIDSVAECSDGPCVVLDLQGVSFIDSSGLHALIRPAVEGHPVVLRRPSRAVQTLLDLAGATPLFEIIR